MEDVLPPEARLPDEMYEVAFALRNQLEMHLGLWKPASPELRTVLEFAAQHIIVAPGQFDRALLVEDGSGARSTRRQRVVELPDRMIVRLEEAEREEVEEESEESEEWEEWESEEEVEEITPAGLVLLPAIFGRLPSPLLPAIFARLPLPDIKNLRLLSKEWKSKVGTPGSDFRQVWEKLRTTRVAIIYPLVTKDNLYRFCVSAFDARTNEWYQAIYTSDRHYLSICACEAGLVCFMYYVVNNRMATTRKLKMEEQMRLMVWNPLTGDEDELPALPRYVNERAFHRVVQLSVDRQTKGYTVRLISRASGTNSIPGRYATAVYNTETRFWFSDQCQHEDQALDRFTYGCSYRCTYDDFTGDGLKGIWSYDIANRVLIEAQVDLDLMRETPVALPVSKFAFTEGRVFRLYKGCVSQPYRIEELQYPQGEVPPHGTCTIVKQHRCAPLDNLHEAEYNVMWLFACKGYLMVASKKKPNKRRRRQNGLYVQEQRLWLYDLSTNAWTDLLTFDDSADFANDESFIPYRDFMCELQWDILPRTERR